VGLAPAPCPWYGFLYQPVTLQDIPADIIRSNTSRKQLANIRKIIAEWACEFVGGNKFLENWGVANN